MSSSSKNSADKANILGKREPEDDLETKQILKKQKETSEEKETREGFDDSLQEIKGRVELLETKSDDHANLIPLKETVEGLDETPDFVEEVAVRKKTLFIANLSSKTKLPDIINFFKDVGEVFSVRLIVNHRGKHVGCGFVEFASANEAKKALEKKNGERLHLRCIFLDVAKIAPYPLQPKYNLAEKLWYEDHLRRESLLIDEDVLETQTKSQETEKTDGRILR